MLASETQFSARYFKVNGYQLAAKEWHAGAKYKVIACHGWLDNAASFDALAALLTDCHVIALDMPGHGLSDHKPPQASYNIWDDLQDILAVADEMGWKKFNLIGHSRGAAIAMLLASSMPALITSIVMLDGIVPQSVNILDTAKQQHNHLVGQRKAHRKNKRGYNNVDEAIAARRLSATISEQSARLIVERGLLKKGALFYWRYDPRLSTPSAFKMTDEHNHVLISALTAPNLLIVADEGMGSNDRLMKLLASYKNINQQRLPGSHHFHMEEQAEAIAVMVRQLFAEHNS
jgi:pimeloyl-ACP methyl ester carboxylesterase